MIKTNLTKLCTIFRLIQLLLTPIAFAEKSSVEEEIQTTITFATAVREVLSMTVWAVSLVSTEVASGKNHQPE